MLVFAYVARVSFDGRRIAQEENEGRVQQAAQADNPEHSARKRAKLGARVRDDTNKHARKICGRVGGQQLRVRTPEIRAT